MGKFSDSLSEHHKAFIREQHMFFVATAPLTAQGRINLSPKGLDSFRILDDNRVGYMDVIGSGNETSAHILENGRITFMFCAFAGKPNILRLYGKGFCVLPGDEKWQEYSSLFKIYPGTRQLIIAEIDLVQTSCGFGVPLYEYTGDRDLHFEWAEKKGADGLKKYVADNNRESIDGLPTAVKKKV